MGGPTLFPKNGLALNSRSKGDLNTISAELPSRPRLIVVGVHSLRRFSATPSPHWGVRRLTNRKCLSTSANWGSTPSSCGLKPTPPSRAVPVPTKSCKS